MAEYNASNAESASLPAVAYGDSFAVCRISSEYALPTPAIRRWSVSAFFSRSVHGGLAVFRTCNDATSTRATVRPTANSRRWWASASTSGSSGTPTVSPGQAPLSLHGMQRAVEPRHVVVLDVLRDPGDLRAH